MQGEFLIGDPQCGGDEVASRACHDEQMPNFMMPKVPMKIGLADGVDQRARGVDHPTQCDQPHGLYIGLDELWNPNHGNPTHQNIEQCGDVSVHVEP